MKIGVVNYGSRKHKGKRHSGPPKWVHEKQGKEKRATTTKEASTMTAPRPLFDRIHAAVTVDEYSLIKTGNIIFYRSPATGFIEANSIEELMAAIDAAKEGTK